MIGDRSDHNNRLDVPGMEDTKGLFGTVVKLMIGVTPAEIAFGLGLGLMIGGFGASWESTSVKGKVISLTLVISGIALLVILMVLKPGADWKP